MDLSIDDVLRFWFTEAGPEKWFRGGVEFDAVVRTRLGSMHERAAAGKLDHWDVTPRGVLALLILLDQVPRNIFRGTPRAFATDAKARAIADRAVELGLDLDLSEDERVFLYLPFEHSEDIADQDRAVRLMAERTTNPTHVDYAERHRRIIERFGRFPHRNAILGRSTTAEEATFLLEPGSSF